MGYSSNVWVGWGDMLGRFSIFGHRQQRHLGILSFNDMFASCTICSPVLKILYISQYFQPSGTKMSLEIFVLFQFAKAENEKKT